MNLILIKSQSRTIPFSTDSKGFMMGSKFFLTISFFPFLRLVVKAKWYDMLVFPFDVHV